MRLLRQLIFVGISCFCVAFTCVKQTGIQINTYTLSSCPQSNFEIPRFSEKEKLLFSYQPDTSFKCEGFNSYSIFPKNDDASPKSFPVSFLMKFNKSEETCELKLIIKRYANRDGTEISAIDFNKNNYGKVDELLSLFIFEKSSIKVLPESKTELIPQEKVDIICGKNLDQKN